MTDQWTEPGRWVSESGRIHYAWPPEGRFKALWDRVDEAFDDDEKHDVLALLKRWWDDNATLVAYTNPETGEWVDVEPDWDQVTRWMRG